MRGNMVSNIKTIVKDWRIALFLVVLLFSIYLISPHFGVDGVAIRSIVKESAAFDAGLQNPSVDTQLVQREYIVTLNGLPVSSVEEYEKAISSLEANASVLLRTNKALYQITTRQILETTVLNETETVTSEQNVSETVNDSVVSVLKNVTTTVPKTVSKIVGVEPLGIVVTPRASTNVKKGLDLQGGTRVVLQPAEQLSPEDMESLTSSMSQRLNVYGLSDITVRSSRDLPVSLGGSGKQFLIVELAGATPEEVQKVVASQGKFEAKIGNTSVFRGGSDITYVCRTSQCSGIDPNTGCSRSVSGGYACSFFFSISLSPEAAARQAQATQGLNVVGDVGSKERFLEKPLDLYLDDKNVSSLQIAADLKGRKVTDITISGSGSGSSLSQAQQSAIAEMKQLRTILVTGSLPVKLEVVKTDAVSSALGADFLKNALIAGLVAIAGVVLLVTIRYRKLSFSLPIVVTMISELIIILGFAVFVGWEIDLAAIAGIIIAIGTGVNHQIIIADELLSGMTITHASLKASVKNAFTIILTSASTVVVALLPLIFAGAGLLKGFALTSIAGVAIGVLLTRPAFAALLQHLHGENS